MTQYPTISDFTLGELTPQFQGMISSPIYHKGALQMVNFMPMRQGGFRKRPGTLYQGHTASDAIGRLIPFVVSVGYAYVVELTNNLIRFWKWESGALVYLSGKDVTTTYLLSELNEIQFAFNFPYLFLVHQNHPPAAIRWASGDNFTYANLTFSGANAEFDTGTIASNVDVTLTTGSLNPDIPGGNTYNNYIGWSVTGSGIPTNTTISGVTDATHFTLSQSSTNGSGISMAISAPYIDGQTPALPFQSSGNYPQAVCVAFQRIWFGNTMNSPLGFWTSVVGMFDTFGNVQMGTYETVSYPYSQMNVDANGQPTSQPPTYTTTQQSENIIGDADGIYQTINSDRNDSIQWIAPDVDLFVGSSSGLWVIPAQATANNVSVQVVSRQGSSAVQGSMVQGGCVFAQVYGKRIGQIGWQGIYNPWVPPDDLTFYADHLFSKDTVVLWDFQQNPETMLWFLRTDGNLRALLMDTVHQVRAWWEIVTTGTVTSLCVIPGDDRDVLCLSVTRNGYNLVEILDDPDWYDPSGTNDGEVNANYLDAAVMQSSGTPFTVVTGLAHLDGLSVGMVGDGAYLGTATVSGGSVTLPTASKVAHVGLPFTATMQTLPLDSGDVLNSTVGMQKSTPAGYIRLYNTLDCEVGADSSHLDPVDVGTSVAIADPPMFSGDVPINIQSDARSPAYIVVVSGNPLPCTVTALAVSSIIGSTE